MKHASLALCLATSAVLLSTSSASAYCRTTTVARQAGRCPEPCVTEGEPLYWGDHDPVLVLNEEGFPDFDSDFELRRTLQRSLDHWNEVECDEDRPIGLDLQLSSGTTDLEVGPMGKEPNDNVIVYFSGEQWANGGGDDCLDGSCDPLPDAAYALTAIWYNRANGEILGADLHFNGGMGRFTECPSTGCPPGDIDLENVTTHEVGHFIGLAHSNEPGSTMLCSADPSEVDKRSLEADDIAGACEIYPEDAFDDTTSTQPGSCDCAVARAGQAWPALSLFSLGFLALFVRRKRQR
jgi:MYXO-CTERM domain-containing protein